jgi:hypothetical protein
MLFYHKKHSFIGKQGHFEQRDFIGKWSLAFPSPNHLISLYSTSCVEKSCLLVGCEVAQPDAPQQPILKMACTAKKPPMPNIMMSEVLVYSKIAHTATAARSMRMKCQLESKVMLKRLILWLKRTGVYRPLP